VNQPTGSWLTRTVVDGAAGPRRPADECRRAAATGFQLFSKQNMFQIIQICYTKLFHSKGNTKGKFNSNEGQL